MTQTVTPIQFLTGGHRSGNATVGFWTSEFDRLQNFYLLPDGCPCVISIRKLVDDGYSFLWTPSQLPMLIPPATHFDFQLDGPFISADRIEHHVPIFKLSVACTFGMPASHDPPDVSHGGGEAVVAEEILEVPDPPPDDEPPLDHVMDDKVLAEVDAEVDEIMARHQDPSLCADDGSSRKANASDHEKIKDDEDEEVDSIPCNHLMTHLPKSRN